MGGKTHTHSIKANLEKSFTSPIHIFNWIKCFKKSRKKARGNTTKEYVERVTMPKKTRTCTRQTCNFYLKESTNWYHFIVALLPIAFWWYSWFEFRFYHVRIATSEIFQISCVISLWFISSKCKKKLLFSPPAIKIREKRWNVRKNNVDHLLLFFKKKSVSPIHCVRTNFTQISFIFTRIECKIRYKLENRMCASLIVVQNTAIIIYRMHMHIHEKQTNKQMVLVRMMMIQLRIQAASGIDLFTFAVFTVRFHSNWILPSCVVLLLLLTFFSFSQISLVLWSLWSRGNGVFIQTSNQVYLCTCKLSNFHSTFSQ